MVLVSLLLTFAPGHCLLDFKVALLGANTTFTFAIKKWIKFELNIDHASITNIMNLLLAGGGSTVKKRSSGAIQTTATDAAFCGFLRSRRTTRTTRSRRSRRSRG
jgi:hypothetical protein